MEQLLIAGIDTVVGANLAAHLADKYRVVGTSAAGSISIEGCETVVLPSEDPHAVRELAHSHRPDGIVICGVAGDSPWHRGGKHIAGTGAVAAARAWTRAARELGAVLTLISSDAVFSGPWMFHGETSTAFCESAAARTLRSLESATIDECPQALVVRTHPYGWNPVDDGLGWIEGILSTLESDRPGVFDCIPHATPILATDLADLLDHAWQANLMGLYHIGGAERTNPHRFVQNLAGVFDLAPPRATLLAPPESVQNGFAQGETSLHTRSACRALGVTMPILIEGLKRLRDQRGDGFDRRFQGSRRFATSRVA